MSYLRRHEDVVSVFFVNVKGCHFVDQVTDATRMMLARSWIHWEWISEGNLIFGGRTHLGEESIRGFVYSIKAHKIN